MRIFFGLLLASLANFFFGILGFYIATTSFIEVSAPNSFEGNLTFTSYFSSFLLKFLVILILTWIMHRVMTMLRQPPPTPCYIHGQPNQPTAPANQYAHPAPVKKSHRHQRQLKPLLFHAEPHRLASPLACSQAG